MTQMDVTKRLGIAQATLSELERTAHGSTHTAQFAALYRCSPVWLATGEGPQDVLEPAEVGGAWPLQLISEKRWMALTERERGAVEMAALEVLERLEAARAKRRGAAPSSVA